MCVRLANLSSDSGENLNDSLDVIDLEPKGYQRVSSAEFELSGNHPSQHNAVAVQLPNLNPSNPSQPPVIRPEDFILNRDNAVEENA